MVDSPLPHGPGQAPAWTPGRGRGGGEPAVFGPGDDELLDLILGGLDLAEAVVSAVDERHRTSPTPCPGVDVESLTGHLLAGLRWFAGLPLGGPADPAGTPDPDLTGLPLAGVFADAARAVRRSWGLVEVEREYVMPWGSTSGRELASFMAVEIVGHAWDIAVGSGQPRYPADDLAETTLAVARGLDEETLRSPGMIGPPVSADPDAPAMDRLVAFLGRDPAWRAPAPGGQPLTAG